MAQDTNGIKDAGKWITDAKPTYTVLIDDKHLVTKLYNMVNVPTGVWINEKGMIVRPNEVAFIDDRFKTFTGMDAAPYVNALKDWVEKGEKSAYVMSEEKLRDKLAAMARTGLLFHRRVSDWFERCRLCRACGRDKTEI